jgi:nucleotide-binding universal stress UspA family protein
MGTGGRERGPVVVGVDSSDSARHASEWAADLAATWHAPLRMVHTVRDGGDAAEVPPTSDSVVSDPDRSTDLRLLMMSSASTASGRKPRHDASSADCRRCWIEPGHYRTGRLGGRE